MVQTPAPKAKRKRKELTPEQKHAQEKRAFARRIRGIFERIGFQRVPEVADNEIEFDGRAGDFDDVLVYENLVLFIEYTVSNPTQVGNHVKGKAHLFNKVNAAPQQFLEMMMARFPGLERKVSKYHPSQVRFRIIYCSKSEIKLEHRGLCPGTAFLWHGSIRYFAELSSAIKRSARYELYDFLELSHSEVGLNGQLPEGDDSTKFHGSVLPEANSNFPPGFKVISFYVSPGAVLSRAYVLRKDSWRDSQGLYQRMIHRNKIESIRRYLQTAERVFVNNVILTLPDDTELIDSAGQAVDPAKIDKTQAITVRLPKGGNSVGIVDGQHRIFSYYEDAYDNPKIDLFRGRQNLLATGIMYPSAYSAIERERFEAKLFLEINSTQNAAKSGLRQAISLIVQPFAPDSIGRLVIQNMAQSGPLEGLLEKNFYDLNVLRTTTIVSYGLRALVRLDGEDSLFQRWSTPEKRAALSGKKDEELLKEYAKFAAAEIGKFVAAARATVGISRWALRSQTEEGVLTVTFVNGLLVLFRQYLKTQPLAEFSDYRLTLTPLANFNFASYKSSQYTSMGMEMLKRIMQPPV